jgi:hypothetical protein
MLRKVIGEDEGEHTEAERDECVFMKPKLWMAREWAVF